MTSPKKEKFLERYQPMMGVPVTHGVGGSFDILAGVTAAHLGAEVDGDLPRLVHGQPGRSTVRGQRLGQQAAGAGHAFGGDSNAGTDASAQDVPVLPQVGTDRTGADDIGSRCRRTA